MNLNSGSEEKEDVQQDYSFVRRDGENICETAMESQKSSNSEHRVQSSWIQWITEISTISTYIKICVCTMKKSLRRLKTDHGWRQKLKKNQKKNLIPPKI